MGFLKPEALRRRKLSAWILTVVVLIAAVFIIASFVMGWWDKREIGGIPVYMTHETGIGYPSRLIGLSNTSNIELKSGEIEWIEGVFTGDSIRWPRGSVCINESLNLSEGAVIRAQIRVIEVNQNVCSKAEVLDYEVIYSPEELADVASHLCGVCYKIDDYVNVSSGQPFTMEWCLGLEGEGLINFRFTWYDYEWIPFENKLVGDFLAYSETKATISEHCEKDCYGAIVIDMTQKRIESIYLSDIFEGCTIH